MVLENKCPYGAFENKLTLFSILAQVYGCTRTSAEEFEKSRMDRAVAVMFPSLCNSVLAEIHRLEEELGTNVFKDLDNLGLTTTPQTVEHLLCEFRKLRCGTFARDSWPAGLSQAEIDELEIERDREYKELFECVTQHLVNIR